ncbi:SRPBCC family protein [Gynuella sp.]|uniref:SRPBCC family protein n=1 Tax=Gynuella sp. TaxID=2969146 RepID=UPI003D11390F
MRREVRTEIEIDTSIQDVWKVLTDFDTYHQWNPFLTRIQGNLQVGNELHISVTFPNQDSMNFKASVVAVEEGNNIRWFGKFLLKSIFSGTHSLELESISEHRCRLINREEYGGFLIRFMWAKLAQNAADGFMQMNQGLKRFCEHKGA